MLWVPLVYHPYRFAGRVETAPEAVSVFIMDCPLTTNVYMDTFNLYHHAFCLASWQSPASSIQCFHWDRLYAGMSAGIGATVIAREAAGADVAVFSSCVDSGIDASVEDAGVGVPVADVGPGVLWGIGVGVKFADDGGAELDSAAAAPDVGFADGVGIWPEQACKGSCRTHSSKSNRTRSRRRVIGATVALSVFTGPAEVAVLVDEAKSAHLSGGGRKNVP